MAKDIRNKNNTQERRAIQVLGAGKSYFSILQFYFIFFSLEQKFPFAFLDLNSEHFAFEFEADREATNGSTGASGDPIYFTISEPTKSIFRAH